MAPELDKQMSKIRILSLQTTTRMRMHPHESRSWNQTSRQVAMASGTATQNGCGIDGERAEGARDVVGGQQATERQTGGTFSFFLAAAAAAPGSHQLIAAGATYRDGGGLPYVSRVRMCGCRALPCILIQSLSYGSNVRPDHLT